MKEKPRAFPKSGPVYSEGMYLRDYFATAALQGMLASAPVVDRMKVKKLVWAKVAYSFANRNDAIRAQSQSSEGY